MAAFSFPERPHHFQHQCSAMGITALSLGMQEQLHPWASR
nr:MAG TPA: hypothetical protein [Caudoviricetes sp.]